MDEETGTLNNKVPYMHEPPRYEGQGEHTIKRLHRLHYELKQTGRKWYDTLTRSLADLGFCISYADPGVFLCNRPY